MSFEGYYEYLCSEGHYFCFDAYDEEPDNCPYCESHITVRHLVDETNGYGFTFKQLLTLVEAGERKECEACKSYVGQTPSVYQQPTDSELEEWRKLEEQHE